MFNSETSVGRPIQVRREADLDGNVWLRLHSWDARGKLTVRLYRVDALTCDRTGELTGFALVGLHATHHVAVEPWGHRCDCPDYEFRSSRTGEPCKHLRALTQAGVL